MPEINPASIYDNKEKLRVININTILYIFIYIDNRSVSDMDKERAFIYCILFMIGEKLEKMFLKKNNNSFSN